MIAIFFLSLACAACSFLAEHLFSIQPCQLCWAQRAFYLALIPTAFLGFFNKKTGKALCLLLLAGNLFIAAYHTLIQFGILDDRCKTGIAVRDSASYLTMLQEKRSCADSWKIFEIPVSALNGLMSIGLMVLLKRTASSGD